MKVLKAFSSAPVHTGTQSSLKLETVSIHIPQRHWASVYLLLKEDIYLLCHLGSTLAAVMILFPSVYILSPSAAQDKLYIPVFIHQSFINVDF